MHTIPWRKMASAEPLRLEVYWVPGSRNVATPPEVSIVKGVFVWKSTDASVASGHSGDFDVYFIHDASAAWFLGSVTTAYWQPLGTSSTVFRSDPTQCIRDLLAKLFPNQKPYHAWAGHIRRARGIAVSSVSKVGSRSLAWQVSKHDIVSTLGAPTVGLVSVSCVAEHGPGTYHSAYCRSLV